MSEQDPGELTSSTIDSINEFTFEDFEHDSIEKSIEKIVTDLNKVNRIHRRETRRKTFRALMELLQDIMYKLERDEGMYSLGNIQNISGRIKDSDKRILQKANLAISELLDVNKTLRREQRFLKRKLLRQGKNKKS